QTKLRDLCGINLLFVAEAYRFESQEHFAGFVHRLYSVLETPRTCGYAKLIVGGYHNRGAGNWCVPNGSDKGSSLNRTSADANRALLPGDAVIGDVNI